MAWTCEDVFLRSSRSVALQQPYICRDRRPQRGSGSEVDRFLIPIQPVSSTSDTSKMVAGATREQCSGWWLQIQADRWPAQSVTSCRSLHPATFLPASFSLLSLPSPGAEDLGSLQDASALSAVFTRDRPPKPRRATEDPNRMISATTSMAASNSCTMTPLQGSLPGLLSEQTDIFAKSTHQRGF